MSKKSRNVIEISSYIATLVSVVVLYAIQSNMLANAEQLAYWWNVMLVTPIPIIAVVLNGILLKKSEIPGGYITEA